MTTAFFFGRKYLHYHIFSYENGIFLGGRKYFNCHIFSYDYGGDYGGFFGSGFPNLFGAPRVRVVVVPVDEVGLDGGVGGLGDILGSIFGPTRDLAPPSEVEAGSANDCGVMCTFLKELLEGHLKGVREHIDDVRDRENEIGGDYDFGSDSDEGFYVNNSTHSTKVTRAKNQRQFWLLIFGKDLKS